MINVSPYLMFDGNCKEAMEFYEKHLGAQGFYMTYGQSQPGNCPPGSEDKMIHVGLKKGDFLLMASDNVEAKTNFGDNVHLYLNCESTEEVDRLFKIFSEGGKELMKPDNTFWGAYFAMVVDKYKTQWMLGFELNPQK